ncbi:hypothetical protein BS47DRAFT_244746 [Hydnum rufescens UP504]|uniref:Uncharacterized protein n=1 Tax=Hydnum rufescens UP504 TaxID=1448309 RepID=A0A9P6AMW4_9AGAM|nr:hypothetical protein BS47DRAFT_244746 [Hydnum rufescens UP504]
MPSECMVSFTTTSTLTISFSPRRSQKHRPKCMSLTLGMPTYERTSPMLIGKDVCTHKVTRPVRLHLSEARGPGSDPQWPEIFPNVPGAIVWNRWAEGKGRRWCQGAGERWDGPEGVKLIEPIRWKLWDKVTAWLDARDAGPWLGLLHLDQALQTLFSVLRGGDTKLMSYCYQVFQYLGLVIFPYNFGTKVDEGGQFQGYSCGTQKKLGPYGKMCVE